MTRAQLLDSLRYTAPEVLLGKPASAASDVFALASVAVCSLTGSPPYRDRPPGEYVVFRTTAPAPTLVSPDGVPATEINAVLSAAMAQDPAARPSPAAFAAALSDAIAQLPPDLHDAGSPLAATDRD